MADGPAMVEQIPRHCLNWLLVAQLALIAPHLERLPIWMIFVWMICAGWRLMVFQGRWSFPRRLVKLALLAGCVAGIRVSYGGWTGLDATVALLIAGFSFKLLESSSRRDGYVLLFLGYFVALTEFLFEQGPGYALYMLLPVLLLTTALVALHQPERIEFSWQPLRRAALLGAQALPLMLLLFLVFPRLDPLWQVPLPGAGGAARSGLSDEIAPGDVARLALSSELAFRASFDGPVPAVAALYWRGLVFDTFDGRAWRAGEYSDVPRPPQPAPGGPAIDYRVYLEPTHRRWLYALELPASLDAQVLQTYDHRLLAPWPVYEKFSYRARAYPRAPLDPELHPRMRERVLALPAAGNPRTRAFAEELRANAADDVEVVERLLRFYRNEPFAYTLRPPPLGADSVDQFLFDTRRGFCEHYASSFVFALRAAGVPARVVAGYQGGEVNPLTGTVLVHQFDAHAWAEVWLPGRGWVRFDPTAAVAPQRIERGLEGAIERGEFLADSPLAASRYRHLGWLNTLRLRLDAMNYAWTRWVVNYRDETQVSLLQRLLGEISPWRLAGLLVGGGALVLALVALAMLGRGRAPAAPPEQKLYRQLCTRLARRGYPRPPGLAPGAYARWVLAEQPSWRWLAEATECFDALSYRPLDAPQRRALLRRLRRLVRGA